LGPLNSSTGCFWMKQVFMDKGVGGIGGGIGDEAWEPRYEHDGTKLSKFPVPKRRPSTTARRFDRLARELSTILPAAICAREVPTARRVVAARKRCEEISSLEISLQEEIDWECYRLYGILDEELVYPKENVPPLQLGQRAFEIVLARKIEAGEVETTWFERHGSSPTTEIPSHWPEDYRKLVQRRIEAIEQIPEIGLIERPEYKRRWNTESWESQEERALRGWLLDRLEDKRHWPEIALTSTARLADSVRKDEELMQVAALYRKNPDFDVATLVAELVEEESVPFLPVYRYKDSGLRNRKQWEETWALQRREDEIDARTKLPEGDPNRLSKEEAEALKAKEVGDIPVPPKYSSKDFKKQSYWRLRGKLDVPKERFVSYPGCEREADPTTVVAWAGWNHLEQARALAGYYVQMRDQEGWPADRLVPLLAGIVELLPWLRQWHNDVDPEYNVRMGDYYADFVREEARRLGLTEEKICEWQPGWR
ncbi:MAG: BREX-2 system adenine-specific DNA-methyltransferase PglX, partial [Candidatus Binatia bacterium]